MKKIDEIKKQFSSHPHKQSALAVLFSTIAIFCFCYFGSASFFEQTFSVSNMQLWKNVWHNTMCFIIFFGGGLIFSKTVLKTSLKNVGCGHQNAKLGWKLLAISVPVAILVGILSTTSAQMCQTYPLATTTSAFETLVFYGSYVIYYVGFEFLFRGLLLQTLENETSPLMAICITAMLSALIHTSIGGFGKPMVETLSAIPAGFAFGLIAHKTKSMWFTFGIHLLIGLATDAAIILLIL